MSAIPEIEEALKIMLRRTTPAGGFSATDRGPFRPDCTAWAVLAFRACECKNQLIQPALTMLAKHQLEDGRVPLLKEFKEAYWPTALSLLAWDQEPGFDKNYHKAVDFLLSTKSLTFPYDGKAHGENNSTLVGWPWVENTYAWVIPTALAMIALKAHGLQNHPRVSAGAELLLDRQLPDGGWNYGDTFVFGTQLLPFPDTTGIALEALSGLCDRTQVEISIRYLLDAVSGVRSPQSLSWAILGLGAWSSKPESYRAWLGQCVALQNRYGQYDTDLLAQILVAGYNQTGFSMVSVKGEG